MKGTRIPPAPPVRQHLVHQDHLHLPRANLCMHLYRLGALLAGQQTQLLGQRDEDEILVASGVQDDSAVSAIHAAKHLAARTEVRAHLPARRHRSWTVFGVARGGAP